MAEFSTNFHVWRPATWLQVSGTDAFSFLQGQFSNDLRALEQGGAVYGLWLNQKGRVLADSFVLKGGAPGTYRVGSYFSPAAVVRERLESHLIADDVLIDDETELWHGLTIFDPAAVMSEGAVSFPGRRGSAAREWLMPREPQPPAGLALTVKDMEVRRISAGLPAVPTDIGPGDLPQEAGLELTAVSFNKGCYLGQEVMARLNSMGTPRRRLFRAKGEGPVLPPGTALAQNGRTIGEMRSSVAVESGWIGLAMCQLAHLKVEQPASAGEAMVRVMA